MMENKKDLYLIHSIFKLIINPFSLISKIRLNAIFNFKAGFVFKLVIKKYFSSFETQLNRFFFLLPLIFSILPLNAKSQKSTRSLSINDSGYLNFPAELNGVRILPLRFEYKIINESKFMLGDFEIETNLAQIEYKGGQSLRFKWPLGLFSLGSLTLLDNVGKKIWSKEFKIEKSSKSSNLNFNDITYSIPESDFETLKELPYFIFCIERAGSNNRASLCSQELYFSSEDQSLTLKSRPKNIKDTFVMINDNLVGEQGIISLNDSTQILNFKIQLSSGSTFFVETQAKPVHFHDFTISTDEKYLQVIASGANPRPGTLQFRINKDQWASRVLLDRPILYLEGEGGIPFRQEFYPTQTLPKELDRVQLAEKPITETLSSEVKLYVKSIEGKSFSLPSKSPDSLVSKQSQIEWTLKNLSSGKAHSKQISVTNSQSTFIAEHSIYRGFSNEASFHLYPSVLAKYSNFKISYSKWLEEFFWISKDWNKLHWSFSMEYESLLSKKSNMADMSSFEGGIHYLWNPDIKLQNSNFKLGLKIRNQSIASDRLNLFGLDANFIKRNLQWNGFLNVFSVFKEFEIHAKYFFPSKKDSLNLQSLFEASFQLYSALRPQLKIGLGLQINQLVIENNTESSGTDYKLIFGTRYIF